MKPILSQFAIIAALVSSTLAVPTATNSTQHPPKIGKRCTGQIQSLSDVAAAEQCTTIVIGGFTVPGGQTFQINAPDGAQISLTGSVTWAYKQWSGPLFKLSGNDVTFNGNGHEFNGNGQDYWDGLGGSGGTTKPDPMMEINISGTFENLKVVNSPERAISVNGDNLSITGVTVDNSAGDAANSMSNGKPAGHNTDGFDVAANNVHITGCTVKNQDDCLAINRGTSITFSGNTCSGGHGISIGSIKSSTTVSGVTISGNTVSNSVQAIRIKTDASASGSIVENVVYNNNRASGISSYGVIIDQSYPSTLGTPGTGVVIEGISFTGSNTISVGSSAHRVEVNCGSTSSCPGTWNFGGLTVTGGKAGAIKNAHVSGGSY